MTERTLRLHELHQRRLESTVGLIENGLERMEDLLSERGRDGVVRVVKDTLSEEDRSYLLEKIRQLRGELREFGAQFSLQQRPLDINQVLNAELSSAWVMLENCQPRRMKGYGQEFDPEVRGALEKKVEELLARVLELRERLR